jgi:hypothetical protein
VLKGVTVDVGVPVRVAVRVMVYVGVNVGVTVIVGVGVVYTPRDPNILMRPLPWYTMDSLSLGWQELKIKVRTSEYVREGSWSTSIAANAET